MSFAKKLGSKVFDDILGIDPSGQGLVGSIRDNPRTAAVLGGLLIPGVGSAITSGLGAAGSAIGSGLGALGGLGSSALGAVGGLSGLGGLLGKVAPYAVGYGLGRQQGPQIPPESFYNMPGMGGGLLGGGAPIGQSAFDYARSIAGGMPFEQVVQPGMEFSLESPMGEPVAPQAQVPPAPVTPLFSGIDASIGGYRDPSERLGGGAFDPFDRFRAPVFDPFRDGIRPSEIRGPGGNIFGGPLGPGGRLEDIIGDKKEKEDDGVYVGGSRDFREYDPLKDAERFRAPEIDPFRDGIRPTEIFGPGGEIIGPMGRMSDAQPRSDQEIIDLIEGRLGEYQPVIPQPDLSGFARLSDIPSFVPRTDEEIRGLISEGIAGIPTPAQFDPSGLLGRIGGLERQIGEIPQFDPSELQRRLAALEGREIPQFDPSGILSRLSALEAQGEPRYTQPGTEKDIVPPRSPLGKLSLFG